VVLSCHTADAGFELFAIVAMSCVLPLIVLHAIVLPVIVLHLIALPVIVLPAVVLPVTMCRTCVLWAVLCRGVVPTVQRAIVLTATQFATYGEQTLSHIAASHGTT
jgi:hypothetical protein